MTPGVDPAGVRLTRTSGEYEIAATCAPGQEPLARDALDALARLDSLRPGLRVRFGWSLLTLREDAPATLTVCEPDFTRDPRRDLRPRLDTTLEVLRRQVAFSRRIGAPPTEVAFDDDVIVRRGALESDPFELFREEPSEGDSGWRVLSVRLPDARDEDFDVVPVFAFLKMRPIVLAVMTLPAGYGVQIAGGRIAHVFDDQGHELALEQQ